MAKDQKATAPQSKEERAKVKADNFKRLAVARTRKALKALDNLSGTFNTNSYAWTTDQADAIIGALQDRLKVMYDRASRPAGTAKEEEAFTL